MSLAKLIMFSFSYIHVHFSVFGWGIAFLKFEFSPSFLFAHAHTEAQIKFGALIFITSFSLANGLYYIRIGFVEGVWMVGMIDEVRMPVTETDRNAILVETKTRVTDTPPPEPQQRKGRYANYSGASLSKWLRWAIVS